MKARLKDNYSLDYNYIDGTDKDIGFSLILPNSINSNNAVYVSDDGKNSVWYTLSDEPIQFQFTLYNYKTIFIIILLSVIIFITFLYKLLNKKKRKLTLDSYNNNSLF